jgi:hypothetical protein
MDEHLNEVKGKQSINSSIGIQTFSLKKLKTKSKQAQLIDYEVAESINCLKKNTDEIFAAKPCSVARNSPDRSPALEFMPFMPESRNSENLLQKTSLECFSSDKKPCRFHSQLDNLLEEFTLKTFKEEIDALRNKKISKRINFDLNNLFKIESLQSLTNKSNNPSGDSNRSLAEKTKVYFDLSTRSIFIAADKNEIEKLNSIKIKKSSTEKMPIKQSSKTTCSLDNGSNLSSLSNRDIKISNRTPLMSEILSFNKTNLSKNQCVKKCEFCAHCNELQKDTKEEAALNIDSETNRVSVFGTAQYASCELFNVTACFKQPKNKLLVDELKNVLKDRQSRASQNL